MCVFVQCLANVNIINGVFEGYGKGQETPTITFYMIKAKINRYLEAGLLWSFLFNIMDVCSNEVCGMSKTKFEYINYGGNAITLFRNSRSKGYE
jgi:hypothetical protein